MIRDVIVGSKCIYGSIIKEYADNIINRISINKKVLVPHLMCMYARFFHQFSSFSLDLTMLIEQSKQYGKSGR